MRPLVPILATIALAAAIVAAVPPAGAAGETCRGEAATIVGSPQTYQLTGTEGRDIIVTNGAYRTSALGGDDLVCLTGRNSGVSGAHLLAGDGNDVVDATGLTGFGGTVQLGAGSDRFEGTSERDFVWGGIDDETSRTHLDTERDVILTGPPTSSVYEPDRVYSGQRGATNDDEVRMVRGTLFWAGVPGSSTVVEGGTSSALVLWPAASETVAIDNVTGTMVVDAQPALRFNGFAGFHLVGSTGPKTFTFRGSDRDESIGLELSDTSAHTIRLGGGDDSLGFYSYGVAAVPKGTSYDGGAGRDTLDLILPDEVDLDLDLARGRLSTGPTASEVTVRARRFEDASVMAKDVELVGTSVRNDLRVYACRATVSGRGGKDTLTAFDEVMDEGLACRRPQARFSGDGGNDVLTGGRGPDRLLGGPGRDSVDGQDGRDVCQGEKVRRCEVRR